MTGLTPFGLAAAIVSTLVTVAMLIGGIAVAVLADERGDRDRRDIGVMLAAGSMFVAVIPATIWSFA